MTIILKPETEERLRVTALREGQDADTLAETLLAEVLAQREQEFAEDIAAVQDAWAAIHEGRERPVEEFLAEHRQRFPDPASTETVPMGTA